MKHSRRKRTPALDVDKLKETSSQIRSEAEIAKLKAYFSLLEEMRVEQNLNTPFISMEALARMTTANSEGYNQDDVLAACPDAWGHETISVPLTLLTALRNVWDTYLSTDGSVSLGESFRIEGKGQGKRKMKARLEQRLKNHRITNSVEVAYLASGNAGEQRDALSLEAAIEQVAEAEKLSTDAVRKIHQEYSTYVRGELKNKGLIKGD